VARLTPRRARQVRHRHARIGGELVGYLVLCLGDRSPRVGGRRLASPSRRAREGGQAAFVGGIQQPEPPLARVAIVIGRLMDADLADALHRREPLQHVTRLVALIAGDDFHAQVAAARARHHRHGVRVSGQPGGYIVHIAANKPERPGWTQRSRVMSNTGSQPRHPKRLGAFSGVSAPARLSSGATQGYRSPLATTLAPRFHD
jgi:hypothetical protein